MDAFQYHFLGIEKKYADKTVLHNARLKIKTAQCTVLIGANGAGKTTLLKILSGLEKPDQGSIRIDSAEIKWGQGKSRLLKNFMYLHQQPYMFDGTVEKNLKYLLKVSRQPISRIEEAVEWAGLQDILSKNAKNLSGGEKQRVAIARAFLRNPQVVLLDEPTANLDQLSKIRTLKLLQQFKDSGIATVIASHDPDIFNPIQDERLVLENASLTNRQPRAKTANVAPLHYRNRRRA